MPDIKNLNAESCTVLSLSRFYKSGASPNLGKTQNLYLRVLESAPTNSNSRSVFITVTQLWTRWRLKSPASRLFTQAFIQAQIKENMKLRVTGLCTWNSPVTGEFPAQRASNTENVSIWWRHHAFVHNHWGRYIWEGEVLRMRHRVASLAWVNRMIAPFSVAQFERHALKRPAPNYNKRQQSTNRVGSIVHVNVNRCLIPYCTENRVVMMLVCHYGDVIMGTMASQITSLTIIYST